MTRGIHKLLQAIKVVCNLTAHLLKSEMCNGEQPCMTMKKINGEK